MNREDDVTAEELGPLATLTVEAPTTSGGSALSCLAGALAGVEVAVPLLGLSEPPWRYPFRMHAYSFISHLIYGAETEQVRKSVCSIL
jgi:uncharacterized membrane protein YagU involved in acid resistance